MIRKAAVSGRFYTDNPKELRAEVTGYLKQGKEHICECAKHPVTGCMLPHAGYVFSGAVAGLTLGQFEVPETVVILSPSHTGAGQPLALWANGEWETPLGNVQVESDLADMLLNNQSAPGLFKADYSAHLNDHATEVILPFLQVMRPNVKIVPLCVREYNPLVLFTAGTILAEVLKEYQKPGKEALLLTSSDMSHFLPHDEGKQKDSIALSEVQKLSPAGLFNVCATQNISMCGFAPMTLMLKACTELGATKACITAHTSSGITGKAYGAKMDSVVGYAGAIIS